MDPEVADEVRAHAILALYFSGRISGLPMKCGNDPPADCQDNNYFMVSGNLHSIFTQAGDPTIFIGKYEKLWPGNPNNSLVTLNQNFRSAQGDQQRVRTGRSYVTPGWRNQTDEQARLNKELPAGFIKAGIHIIEEQKEAEAGEFKLMIRAGAGRCKRCGSWRPALARQIQAR